MLAYMCVQVMVPVVGLTDPTALDVDVDQKYVYFAQARSRKIQRVRILEKEARVEDFIIEGVGKVRLLECAFSRHCETGLIPRLGVWRWTGWVVTSTGRTRLVAVWAWHRSGLRLDQDQAECSPGGLLRFLEFHPCMTDRRFGVW